MTNNQASSGSGILVIFDLDGTLYRTETSFFPAVDLLFKAHRMTRQSAVRLEKFIGEPMHVFIEWIKSLEIEASEEELVHEFDMLEIEEVKRRGELYPGVKSVLSELSGKGATLGICSNGQARYIEAVLGYFKIRSFFSIISYPERRNQTKAVMLKEIKRRYAPRKAFMVGDRIHDIRGARSAGFISVGVEYGYGLEEIQEADYIINALPELLNIVSGENEQNSLKD